MDRGDRWLIGWALGYAATGGYLVAFGLAGGLVLLAALLVGTLASGAVLAPSEAGA